MVDPSAASNAREFRAQIAAFPGFVAEELDKQFAQMGFVWVRAMQKRLRSGTTTPPGVRKGTGDPVGSRTGRLGRSLFSEVKGKGPVIKGKSLRFGSRMPGQKNYAGIHEEGGEIRPKRRKFLAVPLPDAYRGRAVADPPRAYKDTFVFSTTGGRIFIVREQAGKFEFLFELRKKVKIEPRLGMVETMRKIIQDESRNRIVAALETGARRAFA